MLIGWSEDLNEVTRLGVSGEVRRVRVIRGHLQHTPNNMLNKVDVKLIKQKLSDKAHRADTQVMSLYR